MQYGSEIALRELIVQLVLDDVKGTSVMLGHQLRSFSLSHGVADTGFDWRSGGRDAGHVISKGAPT